MEVKEGREVEKEGEWNRGEGKGGRVEKGGKRRKDRKVGLQERKKWREIDMEGGRETRQREMLKRWKSKKMEREGVWQGEEDGEYKGRGRKRRSEGRKERKREREE